MLNEGPRTRPIRVVYVGVTTTYLTVREARAVEYFVVEKIVGLRVSFCLTDVGGFTACEIG